MLHKGCPGNNAQFRNLITGAKKTLPYCKFVLNHSIYDKIYTIGYYSGFHSCLRDKILANGDHFELS